MNYFTFLKSYGVTKFPGSTGSAEGWEDWNASPRPEDGICRKKGTANFYRFTSAREGAALAYSIGKKIVTRKPGSRPHLTKYHFYVK